MHMCVHIYTYVYMHVCACVSVHACDTYTHTHITHTHLTTQHQKIHISYLSNQRATHINSATLKHRLIREWREVRGADR